MFRRYPFWSARAVLFLIVTASLLIPGAASAQATAVTTPIDSIVALVDEDVILRSELDLAVAGIVDRIKASGEAMPPQHLLENHQQQPPHGLRQQPALGPGQ